MFYGWQSQNKAVWGYLLNLASSVPSSCPPPARGCSAPASPVKPATRPVGQRPSLPAALTPGAEVGWVCKCRLIALRPPGWGRFAAPRGGARPRPGRSGPAGNGGSVPRDPRPGDPAGNGPCGRRAARQPQQCANGNPALGAGQWASNTTSLLLGEY